MSAAGFYRLWHEIGERDERARAVWVEGLREVGVKAAHPDDGWHDRGGRRVLLCYPDFDDGVRVGDRLALGRPGEWRAVTVTAIERPILGDKPWYRY